MEVVAALKGLNDPLFTSKVEVSLALLRRCFAIYRCGADRFTAQILQESLRKLQSWVADGAPDAIAAGITVHNVASGGAPRWVQAVACAFLPCTCIVLSLSIVRAPYTVVSHFCARLPVLVGWPPPPSSLPHLLSTHARRSAAPPGWTKSRSASTAARTRRCCCTCCAPRCTSTTRKRRRRRGQVCRGHSARSALETKSTA